MKRKILVVLFSIHKAQEHEWFVDLINRERFDIEFALINGKGSFMDNFLKNHHVVTHYYSYSGKSDLPIVTWNLYKLIKRNMYDVVHTHLFESNLAGITAAWLAGVKKRIITRHHPDFHHIYFPSAVKYDKFTNKLATDIIAISKNVEQILLDLESVPRSKVHLIHHGIDITDYVNISNQKERIDRIRSLYGLTSPSGPVIGVISRFIHWKGLQYIIPAFIEVLKEFPDATLVLANAKGDYTGKVNELLAAVEPSRYRLIEFENDIVALYQIFDCFVHVPVSAASEAFGQTYLEAMASKIPSVFTLSGVAPEFAVDKVNCLVVPFTDSDAIQNAVLYILKNKEEMKSLEQNGFDEVKKRFDIKVKINKLQELYS